jgi:hypothetical protein
MTVVHKSGICGKRRSRMNDILLYYYLQGDTVHTSLEEYREIINLKPTVSLIS